MHHSNKKGAGILDRAASHKIPCKYIAVKGRSKETYDDEVSACLKKSGVQLILMVRTYLNVLNINTLLSSIYIVSCQDGCFRSFRSLLDSIWFRNCWSILWINSICLSLLFILFILFFCRLDTCASCLTHSCSVGPTVPWTCTPPCSPSSQVAWIYRCVRYSNCTVSVLLYAALPALQSLTLSPLSLAQFLSPTILCLQILYLLYNTWLSILSSLITCSNLISVCLSITLHWYWYRVTLL